MDDVRAQLDRIKTLEEALRFYASEWVEKNPGTVPLWLEPSQALWDDAGAKAIALVPPK
jgi:hypothetical protein